VIALDPLGSFRKPLQRLSSSLNEAEGRRFVAQRLVLTGALFLDAGDAGAALSVDLPKAEALDAPERDRPVGLGSCDEKNNYGST
jgi:hypothetical protein